MTNIEGRGSILLQCKNGDHKLLVGVYFILCLTVNIVSLGQLEEDGHRILLFGGHLKIWDQHGILVVKAACAMN
jgi:hypothetical protein